MKKNLTHFTKSGNAHMVDIKNKDTTHRIAIASGKINMSSLTIKKIKEGSHKKGDVLGISRIAAITASKKASDLIPLCHNINLSSVNVDFKVNVSKKTVTCQAKVETTSQTGVEIEAITAVQIGLLTIYDMCKSIDRGMVISDIQLESKSGGASGEWKRGN
jgi:cyclic pyranopterin phosphate synthase